MLKDLKQLKLNFSINFNALSLLPRQIETVYVSSIFGLENFNSQGNYKENKEENYKENKEANYKEIKETKYFESIKKIQNINCEIIITGNKPFNDLYVFTPFIILSHITSKPKYLELYVDLAEKISK